MKVPRFPEWLSKVSVVLQCLVALAGAAVVFIALDSVHRALAWLSVLAIAVGLPIAIASLTARIARRWKRTVAFYPIAVRAIAPCSAVAAVLLLTVTRSFTGGAFTSFPARYPDSSIVGDLMHALGLAISPEGAGGDRRTTTTSAGPSKRAGVPRYSTGDSNYHENGCESLASVDDLDSGFQPGSWRKTAEALATRRYPDGIEFLRAQDHAMLSAWFAGATTSFEGVASRFETAVHEGSHVWGARRFNGQTQSYPVRRDLTVETRLLKNFDRSEILQQHVDRDADSYAKIYLVGKSGAQGFNTLLDEYNAYTHGLASRVCTRDLVPSNSRVSARDGILTMMYYVGSYLRIGRTKHPADYAEIVKDPGHRRMILLVWDRAEFWLRKSADAQNLGIRDDVIEGWAYADENLAEIAHVRAANAPRAK